MYSESISVFRATPIPPAASMQPLPLKGEDNGATCEVCGVYLRRNTDLPRHMLTHNKDKESLMFRCPVDGCGHQTLQKSNLATHIRTHTRAKPHKCPEIFANGLKCDFSTADPSSLHRHRKRKHGYASTRPKPPPQRRSHVARREREGEGEGNDVDAEGEADAEGSPRSECESEESFGLRGESSKAGAAAAVAHGDGDAGGGGGSDDPMRGGQGDRDNSGGADDDDDADRDGEGEPENETEPVLLSTPPSHLMNISSERTEPLPPPPLPVDPPMPMARAAPAPAFNPALIDPALLDQSPPGLGLTLTLELDHRPALVFANISDTRTYVDAQ